MDQKPRLLVDLPSDVLLRVFSECCVLDILSISSTCKQLQQTADEYQVWLDQARCLQIPIPPGMAPSKAELKDWVLSRARVDVCWTKSRPGDLLPHPFETGRYFVDAHFIPGGEFIVLLYYDGDIGLNKIERSAVTGELEVREVARYNETNRDLVVESWSSLLTDTSYGYPVLVLVDSMFYDHEVFVIDPVSRVIKKQGARCDHDAGTIVDVLRVSAIKNRVFFICEDEDEATRITVIEESGPNVVKKRFCLLPLAEYDPLDVRFFVISENCFIVTDCRGILLYHIPELGAADEDAKLVPVWNRMLDASDYRGTLYETASPYPGLWLQGEQSTHAIEFDVDGSGCYPVVVNHHITEGQPVFHVGDALKLQGRKGMSIETGLRDEIVINTGVLGKPDTRRLRVSIPGLNVGSRFRKEKVKYTDLDEMTGRVMIVVGREDEDDEDIPYAKKLYIADLPT